MTDNKRVTNKQLQEELKKLTKEFETMNITVKLDKEDLTTLSVGIVSRMMNIQTMTEWHEHVSSSDVAIEVMEKRLDMTEEENAVGDAAKYMTLMNLFEDKEEYEKCAICKLKLNNVEKILKKY
tara:strand:+ start:94 stop:465 length:372 start_codon:yes stop_codon:yes gene_type:complete